MRDGIFQTAFWEIILPVSRCFEINRSLIAALVPLALKKKNVSRERKRRRRDANAEYLSVQCVFAARQHPSKFVARSTRPLTSRGVKKRSLARCVTRAGDESGSGSLIDRDRANIESEKGERERKRKGKKETEREMKKNAAKVWGRREEKGCNFLRNEANEVSCNWLEGIDVCIRTIKPPFSPNATRRDATRRDEAKSTFRQMRVEFPCKCHVCNVTLSPRSAFISRTTTILLRLSLSPPSFLRSPSLNLLMNYSHSLRMLRLLNSQQRSPATFNDPVISILQVAQRQHSIHAGLIKF